MQEEIKWDERSGEGSCSNIPTEIQNWNWGAAGLTWIWGISNGVWISLLVFLPFLNMIMIIMLGLKGNEWAWRKKKWKSVDEFIAYQNKWRPWGIAFFALTVFGFLANILQIAKMI